MELCEGGAAGPQGEYLPRGAAGTAVALMLGERLDAALTHGVWAVLCGAIVFFSTYRVYLQVSFCLEQTSENI